jgi:hypothetical protein
MTKIFNSIAIILKAIINSLSQLIIKAEHALQSQFIIKPIKKENLGVLNSLILASGIISILLLSINFAPTLPIMLSIELVFVSLLLLTSIWVTTNHYIHTLIAIMASVSMFKWLYSVSYNWSNIIYIIALIILFLFVTYFDLLKKNLVLQLTNVALLFMIFNSNLASKFDFENIFAQNSAGLTVFNPETIPNLLPVFLSQFLILPILYIAIQLARRTNRIAFVRIMNPIFHILTIAFVITLILLTPPAIAIILLIIVLITALIMALHNHYHLSFAYITIFLVASLILILNNTNLGQNLPYTLVIAIFPLITAFAIIGKFFIDKGLKN